MTVIQPRQCLAIWGVVLLLLGLACPAVAHNGAVAVVVPVEGITIDGDLSDWPDMMHYPITRAEYGMNPVNEADFNGEFYLGYNKDENALYLALEILDESVVIDTTVKASWDTQDGCEIYIETAHADRDAYTTQYARWGQSNRAQWKSAVVGVQREQGQHRYEWRFDIEKMSEGTLQLSSGTVLSLDVVVNDKDED